MKGVTRCACGKDGARQALKQARHSRFRIRLPFRSLGARRHGSHKRNPAVVGKGVGDVGLQEPELRPRATRQRQIAVVREIKNATIRSLFGRQASELRNARVPPVHADDKLCFNI
jgi:hypothetical protein